MHFGGIDPRLSESELFKKVYGLRTAAQFGRRERKRKELDQLLKQTDFTRSQLKSFYWGWKCCCPSGALTESNLKEIYAQLFPQAGMDLVSCPFTILSL